MPSQRNSLFEKFISEANFKTAFDRISKKRKKGGIDQVSVEEFQENQEANLVKLRSVIRQGKYCAEPVQSFLTPKFNESNEWRELGLPTIADKVVQAAMLLVMEPIAEKIFLDVSYGYRIGKGPHKALKRVEHNLTNRKQQWVAHGDIDNCFNSFDHDLLLKTFADLVEGDVRMIEIMAVWCRMGVVDRNGQWKNVESGVRQGQIIAPLIANLYLHPLDELANDKRWGWIRYADNFLIQLSEEEQINHAILEVDEFVKQSLKLRLNKEESPVRHLDQGFSFLGVCFKGATKSIDVKKINKMNRRIAWVLSEKNRSDPQIILQQLHETIEGWRQYYGFLSPDEQFTELDRQIEDALSSLIRNRIATSSWPVTPPENLELPSLMEHPGDNRKKRLALIWGKSRPVDLSGVKKTADKKISQKRQHYKRAEVQGGELVVTSPGLFVGIREGQIVVREKQTVVAKIPSMQLRGITLAGKGVSLSSDVVCFCASQDVHIHFIDGLGKIIAVAYPPSGSAAEVSICQIRHAEDAVGQQIARTIVYGKVKNQLALLKYFGKYQNSKNGQFREVFVEKETEFNALIKKIRQMKHTDDSSFKQQLMGLEGASAAIYWKLVAILLPSSVGFAGRKREGATDLVNSLLNYGYGILYSRILNIVIRVGLNPVCSFLHSYQSNKPTLIYDMVEEFRSFAVDRAVFTLLNRRERLELNTEHRLTDETRKKLTRAVLNKIGSETVFRGKKQTIERIMQHQVDHLKQVLIKGGQYRPFLARW